MASHANACVRKCLDILFALFGGDLLDDPLCPATPLAVHVVYELALPLLGCSAAIAVLEESFKDAEDRWEIVRRLVILHPPTKCSNPSILHPSHQVLQPSPLPSPGTLTSSTCTPTPSPGQLQPS